MPVKFQKFVLISNPRLECLYVLVCLLLAGFLTFKFLWFQEYLFFYDVGQYVHVSMWPQFASPSEVQAAYAAHAATCDALEGGCIPVCSTGETYELNQCIFAETMGVSVSAQELMFVTSITSQNLSSGVDVVQYLPFEDVSSLRFSFSMSVPSRYVSPAWTSRKEDRSWGDPLYSSDEHDLLTVILDHEGSVHRVESNPDYDVVLTVSEMLRLAGLGENWLDELQPATGLRGYNVVGRLSGVELMLSVDCYDRGASWQYVASKVLNKLDGYEPERFCAVSVVQSPERSSRKDAGSPFSAVKHLLHGIHVTAKTGGQWSRTDFVLIFDALVQAYVLSAIPKGFVLLVAVWFLGHLSKIYRTFIFETFDIAEQVAGTAVRFMSNTVAFEELCDDNSAHFSKETMHQRISAAIGSSGSMNEEELNKFVDFSYKAILNLCDFTKHDALSASLKDDMGAAVKTVQQKASGKEPHSSGVGHAGVDSWYLSEEEQPNVDVGSFVTACSSIDKVTIQDTVKLFRRERRVGRLERFFMPRYIRMLVQRSQLSQWTPALGNLMKMHHFDSKIDLKCKETDDTEDHHQTHGTKAYMRVLDLEARQHELEKLAKERIAHRDLEKTIRHLLFPDTARDDDEVECCPSSASGSVDTPCFKASDPDFRTPHVKDLVLSRTDAERATAEAVASARAEVLEQVAELVNAAVQETRQSVLAEVERAIQSAERSQQHAAPRGSPRPPHKTSATASDATPDFGASSPRDDAGSEGQPPPIPRAEQSTPVQKSPPVENLSPVHEEGRGARPADNLRPASAGDSSPMLWPGFRRPALGTRLPGLGPRGYPMSAPPASPGPAACTVGSVLGTSVYEPPVDSLLGSVFQQQLSNRLALITAAGTPILGSRSAGCEKGTVDADDALMQELTAEPEPPSPPGERSDPERVRD